MLIVRQRNGDGGDERAGGFDGMFLAHLIILETASARRDAYRIAVRVRRASRFRAIRLER